MYSHSFLPGAHCTPPTMGEYLPLHELTENSSAEKTPWCNVSVSCYRCCHRYPWLFFWDFYEYRLDFSISSPSIKISQRGSKQITCVVVSTFYPTSVGSKSAFGPPLILSLITKITPLYFRTSTYTSITIASSVSPSLKAICNLYSAVTTILGSFLISQQLYIYMWHMLSPRAYTIYCSLSRLKGEDVAPSCWNIL